MNCSGFSEELQQLVETRGGSPSESLLVHIGECTSCRRQWHDHLLVEAALRAWVPISSAPSLVDGVLNRLVDAPVPPVTSGSGSQHRWSVVATVAACLFIVLGIGLALNLEPGIRNLARDASHPPTTDTVPKTGVPVEAGGVASSVVAVLEDLRFEYAEIAEETRASARELAVVIPSPRVSPWGELMLPEIPKVSAVVTQQPVVASPRQGAVSMIGHSIGSQIGEAMDFLWIAVPDGVPRG